MPAPLTIHSRDNLLRWPRVPVPNEAPVLILMNQFQRTQNLSAEDLHVRQFAQLTALLSHCLKTVPYYQAHLATDMPGIGTGTKLTAELWARIPVLSRADVLAHGAELESTAPPKSHGAIHTVRTPGITGDPVTLKAANVSSLHDHANMVRNGVWHGYDPEYSVANIVRMNSAQLEQADADVFNSWMTGWVSGPVKYFDVAVPPQSQLEWLVENQSQLLVTHPSNLRQLAYFSKRDGAPLPHLRAIQTTGEPLTNNTRLIAQDVFGLPIQDVYGTQEAGILAL
ncbi:MAG: hypothetical protein HN644_06855 [Rhodospirillales bacterium]|nr:hypothetical protein [Rhodospirillales bacterium]MBT4038471.1 hypothetical protein [Rhodospirillales bacterium]MBT4625674.1 hypothetical protein [Rhodospirillales bacterium]MBT5351856.1 hypothetical protein [Rhodospirillales bacterium]MBT6108514.1 hypothetical protein [Rhodospirillales bacterium]